jgi:transcriptional regulator with XRE-family HTH domain
MAKQWLQSRDGKPRDGADDAGQVIRQHRLAARMTQTDLASAMGITQQHVSQIEKGKSAVTLDLRCRFASLLGIPSEVLGFSARGIGIPTQREGVPAHVAASRGQWRAERAWLNQHRHALSQIAARLYPAEARVSQTALITGPGWSPPNGPIPVRSVSLRLDEGPQERHVTGREPESRAVRPLRIAQAPFECYTDAIRHVEPPTLFENRPSYRMLRCALAEAVLDFGLAAYFDKLDISEAIGHEIAAVCMAAGTPSSADELRGRLPLRDLVGDPFDLGRRAVIPAITTLTIRLRRYPAEPSFLLHWRDPAAVATAAGVYDVIPAGEFQPSSVALWDRRNDFDLWRNMAREYSEELLGAPEHDGRRTEPIDYVAWPLYQQLEDAQNAGTITASILGVGLDSLTLAATILTVVVIEDDVFEDIFGQAVRFNEEGEIVGIGDGRAIDGIPFTAEAVARMLASEPMAAPGAACLALAWQYRDELLP